MVGAHPRSPVGLPAETPACTASSLARPTVCTRWRSARTGGSSPPSTRTARPGYGTGRQRERWAFFGSTHQPRHFA